MLIVRFGGKYRFQNAPIRFLLVGVIAVLLLYCATIQVTHIHVDGVSHQDCALCQGVHNVVGPAIVHCVQQVTAPVARVAVPVDRQSRTYIFSYSHWNRPPPDQAA